MALIECPECGRKVSSMAKVCPDCGYPIAEINPVGDVRIKTLKGGPNVRIYNYDTGELLWTGTGNQIATIKVDGPTRIGYVWGLSVGKNGLDKVYTVEAGGKYQVAAGGAFGMKFVLNKVDVLDSE